MSCNGFQPKEKTDDVSNLEKSLHMENISTAVPKKLAINAVYGKLRIYMREMWDRNIMEGLEQDHWTHRATLLF